MNILTIENLVKNFGGVKALQDITFTMEDGTITSIIGPNGAGKTTLFNSISGFHIPDSGKIFLYKKNITKFNPEKIAKVGIARTFQNIRLFPDISVVENIMIGMHLNLSSKINDILLNTNKFKKEEVSAYIKSKDLIDYVGLNGLDEEQAKNLSYGNQRKLEIARALALEPKLLLLDEPAAGLNTQETDEMKDFIFRIRDEKKCSILLIEHDMKLVMGISDIISVLNYGKLIASGTPDEIKNDPNVINAYLGEPEEYSDSIA